jgi:excisionase family DNA binding protein
VEYVLCTVAEAAKALKADPHYVYALIKAKLLPALKMRSLKIPCVALAKFAEDYAGKDLSDPNNIKDLI